MKTKPLKEIDKKQFELLCGLQCTEEEICSFFDVTDKTLTRWCKRTYKKRFSEVFKQKRQRGHVSLRRSQFKLSESNPTMAIWLGKQYLGQKDGSRVTEEISASDGFIEALKGKAKDTFEGDKDVES